MKSVTHKVAQSESELMAIAARESLKQLRHESQKETQLLLQNYQQYFSTSQLKDQKWWQYFTPEDNILSLTFVKSAVYWTEISFSDGDYGKEPPTEQEVIQALSQDEQYHDKLKDIMEQGWEYFFAKSLLTEGRVNLPFPFSVQNHVEFKPMHNGTWIKDPVEMAKLMGIPTQATNSATTQFTQSELDLAENQLTEAYNTVFHKEQEETTLLLNEYKKHFSDSQIKNQEWWSGFTIDDHRIGFTFEDAVKWSKPLFCKGFGYDPVPYTQLLHALSKDERYKWEYETLTKYGWEHFVSESLWNKGKISLPFPISMQNSVKFFPLSDNETFIDDPIEMAKSMGLFTELGLELDPLDLIEPISIAEMKALNFQETSTSEDKTLKQALTEPCRVQKKKGYYSYESFRQMFLTNFLTVDKLTEYQSWLPQPTSKAIYHFHQAALTYFKQEQKDQAFLPAALSFGIDFISTPHKSIFYLDEKLLNMLMQTNLPAKAKISQCFLPSFLLLLPKNNPLGRKSFLFHFLRGHSLLVSTLFADERGVIDCDCFTCQIDQEFETDYFTESFAQCAINFLLWQQSMHDKGEKVIELDAPIRKMGFGKNTKQIIVPQVIGEGYKPKVIRNYEPTGTHASPRTHWRSGHWRQQPYGKKDNPKLKTIWLEPVLVNG